MTYLTNRNTLQKESSPAVLRLNNKNIGILICEDMWSSSFHKIDPVKNFLIIARLMKSSLML